MISSQETQRLFGPLNQPDKNTNVRHRALLRKALELFSVAQLEAIFERPVRLRVVMGSAYTASQLGKIQSHYLRNGRLVSQETPVPDAEARQALRMYLDAYDTYFMKQGNTYRIRAEDALAVIQAAEQTWHDWIVPYLAGLGRAGRPAWALQPLPGLARVRVTAPLPHPATPLHRRRAQVALPTPPSSSPIRPHSPAPRRPRSPAPRQGTSRLHPIDLSNDDVVRPPKRGRFLGLIDISDDDEVEVQRPRKKQKLWRVIDLTL